MGYLKGNENDEVMCPARRRMIDKIACQICIPAWEDGITKSGVFCRYRLTSSGASTLCGLHPHVRLIHTQLTDGEIRVGHGLIW